MKTHKNPALRGSSKVPATSSGHGKSGPSSAYAPKPFQAASRSGAVTRPVSVKKPPKKELQGQKKWIVVSLNLAFYCKELISLLEIGMFNMSQWLT